MARNPAMRTICVLGSLALVVALAGPSLARDKTKAPKKKIELKACAKKKPSVTFDHPAHVKIMKKNKQDCVVCHHLIKKKEPEKDNCSECHKKKQGDLGTCFDKSKKKNPFHIQCVGCHKQAKKKGTTKKAPVKCKGCHPKSK